MEIHVAHNGASGSLHDKGSWLLCYIDAMILKGLTALTLLLGLLYAAAGAGAQTGTVPLNPKPKPSPALSTQSGSSHDCNGGPCEDQQPRIQLTCPVPTAAPVEWPVHDRILWSAYVLLAILGYAGVMLAVSTLRKIERGTAAAEETAKAAAMAAMAATETAKAALMHVQTVGNAERPWVLVTAEATPGVESSFELMATNRGKSPARITSAIDRVVLAVDEAHLPARLEFSKPEKPSGLCPFFCFPESLRRCARSAGTMCAGCAGWMRSTRRWRRGRSGYSCAGRWSIATCSRWKPA
jgi:hypothetical protein